MTRYLLCLSLFSLAVEAQVAECGADVCVGDTGQAVQLGGTVKETRGARADGGVAALQPVVTGASLVLQSIQPTGTSVLPDVIVRSSNVHDGGTILSVRNGNAEVFSVTPAGASGVVSSTTVTATTVAQLKYVVTVGVDAGSVRSGGVYVPIANPDDGGTSMVQRIQYGYGVLSSNDYVVTFNPAFAGIPGCRCSAVNATAAACGLKAVPSASAATFTGTNATDAIYWECIGPK